MPDEHPIVDQYCDCGKPADEHYLDENDNWCCPDERGIVRRFLAWQLAAHREAMKHWWPRCHWEKEEKVLVIDLRCRSVKIVGTILIIVGICGLVL